MNAHEERRRNRVVHGWAFRNLTEEERAEIIAYLEGGPVPKDYEQIDKVCK